MATAAPTVPPTPWHQDAPSIEIEDGAVYGVLGFGAVIFFGIVIRNYFQIKRAGRQYSRVELLAIQENDEDEDAIDVNEWVAQIAEDESRASSADHYAQAMMSHRSSLADVRSHGGGSHGSSSRSQSKSSYGSVNLGSPGRSGILPGGGGIGVPNPFLFTTTEVPGSPTRSAETEEVFDDPASPDGKIRVSPSRSRPPSAPTSPRYSLSGPPLSPGIGQFPKISIS